MKNAIFVIKPYKWNGMWVFDDDRVGLDKEPFVAGADTMIDTAVGLKGISNAASLEEEGIEYHWLEALGGNRKRANDAPPSPNRGIDDEAFRNYADYMATYEFRQAAARLWDIAGDHRTATMCAEGDFRHCRRQSLSDHLVANGITVQHISPTGDVTPHKVRPGAKIVDGTVTYPGQSTLFDLRQPPDAPESFIFPS